MTSSEDCFPLKVVGDALLHVWNFQIFVQLAALNHCYYCQLFRTPLFDFRCSFVNLLSVLGYYYYHYYYVYHLYAGYLQIYIPETNHVSKVHSVGAILWLQFTVHIMLFPMLYNLYFYISTAQLKPDGTR